MCASGPPAPAVAAEFVSAEEWSGGDLEVVAQLYTESFAQYVYSQSVLATLQRHHSQVHRELRSVR
jgi:hypothetical protein